MGTTEEPNLAALKETTQQTEEMLEEMIKSTHRLDEILQTMCAAEPQTMEPTKTEMLRKPTAESFDEGDAQSDDEFQDCIGFAATEAMDLTPEENSFQAHKDMMIETKTSVVNIHKLLDSLNGSGDPTVRFASCARDTSFVFPSLTQETSAAHRGSSNSEIAVAVPPPECNVSYSYFLSRLREQAIACDHILPVDRADAAARISFLLLEEQQRRLLSAISNYFPYQRDSIYWAQGRRLCKWGLLFNLNVTSQLLAQANALSNGSPSLENTTKEHLSIKCCTRCRLFLPKVHYLRSPDSKNVFQASISVRLSFEDGGGQRVTLSKATNHPARKDEDTRRDNAHHDKLMPQPAELPERITISIWGTHDNNPVLDNDENIQSARDKEETSKFRNVQIETVRCFHACLNTVCLSKNCLYPSTAISKKPLDGALGLGFDLGGYIAQPTLVEFFFDNLIVVQDIACGGDQLVGAHSAAVSQDGDLFTWGVGIALGKGTLRSASTPQRVDLPPTEAAVDDTATRTTSTTHAVSCGSGFCVALTRSGHAFSWGKWSDGRLGLGKIPIIARTSRRHGGGAVRKQFQSFQLSPKQIKSIHSMNGNIIGQVSEDAQFLKVTCGDAHCVGISRSGALVTWGRGNSGQQGRGDASDSVTPTVVEFNGGRRWQDVGAGENWSMALSNSGQVWTWGACGGAVLGHGLHGSQKNALLAETILQRHQRLLSRRKKTSVTSSQQPKLPQLKWMTPQRIPCFVTPDIRICRISAGVQHAAAISESGDLYMWGDNYSSVDPSNTGEKTVSLSSLPTLVNAGRQNNRDGFYVAKAADIGNNSVEHVVCGGRHTVAFTSGSFLARSMSRLYREVIAHSKPDEVNEAATIAGADLILVVSGQRLLAHKLLLAQRSPVLRELILEEEQQQQTRLAGSDKDTQNRTELIELLLPQLRVDVAKTLLEFIYTDNFTVDVVKTSHYLVHDVQRAAKRYKLPSLVQLCRERLFSASPSSLFGASSVHDDGADEYDGLSDTNSEEDADDLETDGDMVDNARSLNDDMKFALSDEVWADTVLVAEGQQIPVHRCMLVARSQYFRAVLAFKHLARGSQTDRAIVKVEDSYAGTVRVLRFIYYDQVTLPQLDRSEDISSNEEKLQNDTEAASDQLLEDLVAADKYGLERMKRLCEHAIRVTITNCLEVLAVSELVHAAHLKEVAMRFMKIHLADITTRQEEFRRFQEDFPLLLEELYTSLRGASADEFLLRWHKEVGTSLAAQREEQELQWSKKSTETSFPWVPLSLTIAFGTMYLSLMHAQEHEFPAVPATNLIAIVAIGGAILMGYL
ncbi:unnamed protein product [Phytophthora lilii]|uniref:Unnamed protein product n=1 Tax=Phytophthora lilii TaxID=2077276 RepID=A0A9W6T973_9STRA|nr:unnamed protein product [Phytophthora lilii]